MDEPIAIHLYFDRDQVQFLRELAFSQTCEEGDDARMLHDIADQIEKFLNGMDRVRAYNAANEDTSWDVDEALNEASESVAEWPLWKKILQTEYDKKDKGEVS